MATELSVGVSGDGCPSLCVGPVINWPLVRAVPHIYPELAGITPTALSAGEAVKENGWMEFNLEIPVKKGLVYSNREHKGVLTEELLALGLNGVISCRKRNKVPLRQ